MGLVAAVFGEDRAGFLDAGGLDLERTDFAVAHRAAPVRRQCSDSARGVERAGCGVRTIYDSLRWRTFSLGRFWPTRSSRYGGMTSVILQISRWRKVQIINNSSTPSLMRSQIVVSTPAQSHPMILLILGEFQDSRLQDKFEASRDLPDVTQLITASINIGCCRSSSAVWSKATMPTDQPTPVPITV